MEKNEHLTEPGSRHLLFLWDPSAPGSRSPCQWGSTCMCTLLRSTRSATRNARQSMLKGANPKTRLECGETWFLFCSRTWAQRGWPLRWRQVFRSKNSHLRGFSDPVNRKAAWIPRWARQDCSLISHGSAYIWTNPGSSERKRDCRGWKCLAQRGWFLYDERERSLPQIPQIPHSPLDPPPLYYQPV